MEEVGRAKTSGLNWVEDMEWTRQLDRGWNLDRVRRHARRLMDQYNGTGQLNVSGCLGLVGGGRGLCVCIPVRPVHGKQRHARSLVHKDEV